MKKHNPRQSLTVALSSLAIALAGIGTAQAAGVTDEDILKDAETTHQIVTHGLGTKGQRYSPLAKVNPDTVKDLVTSNAVVDLARLADPDVPLADVRA